jgi:hypothetical protein
VAKPIRKKELKRKIGRQEHLPLARENFVILAIGIAVILAGYAAMSTGTVEGFLPLVIAPILLVVGYCVIIPLGIMYSKKPSQKAVQAPSPEGSPTA